MELAVVARAQAGTFTRRQAVRAGLSGRRLATLERRGLLVRAPGRVYAAATSPASERGRAWAAVLGAGPVCVLTGLAALRAYGCPRAPEPSVLRLLVPASRRAPRLPGVSVTRTGPRDLRGARVVAGLPVSSLAVALRDAARELTEEQTEDLVRDELRRRTVTRSALLAACGRGRAGAARLRRALAACADGAESRAERVLARALRRTGARPVVQHRLGRYRLDLYLPDAGVGIEVDGEQHLDPAEHAYDLRRANRLLADHDVALLRFPARAVLRDPAGVAEEVVAVTCRRRRRRRTSSP